MASAVKNLAHKIACNLTQPAPFGQHINEIAAVLEEANVIINPKPVYHGWIIVEEGGEGLLDVITVEWNEGDSRKRFTAQNTVWDGGTGNGWRGNSGAARAVEWWDAKVGKPIKLLPFLKGSFRVYTEESA